MAITECGPCSNIPPIDYTEYWTSWVLTGFDDITLLSGSVISIFGTIDTFT